MRSLAARMMNRGTDEAVSLQGDEWVMAPCVRSPRWCESSTACRRVPGCRLLVLTALWG